MSESYCLPPQHSFGYPTIVVRAARYLHMPESGNLLRDLDVFACLPARPLKIFEDGRFLRSRSGWPTIVSETSCHGCRRKGRRDPDGCETALPPASALAEGKTRDNRRLVEPEIPVLLSNFAETVRPSVGNAIVSDRKQARVFRNVPGEKQWGNKPRAIALGNRRPYIGSDL